MKNKVEYVKDTFEEYLGKKDHISASDIKSFLASPKVYWNNKYGNKERKEERHFVMGSAFHELILEPDQFSHNYYIGKKYDMRTTQGKQMNENNLIEAKGRAIIFDTEFELIQGMAQSCTENKTLIELLKDSHRELSVYTIDSLTGLKIKVRPDSLSKNKSTIVDIKTCLDSSKRSFRSDVYGYGYNISSAFYMDFIGRENYVFCAVEKKSPFQCSLYELDDEIVEQGRTSYRKALDLLKWSYDNDFWCDYNQFEILQECYDIGNLDNALEMITNSTNLISIITK